MKLRRKNAPPDVQKLFDRQDIEGLAEAARFQAVARDLEGRAVDRGAPVREQAILALGEVGPETASETVATALRDRSDAVRSAAVRVLRARRQVEPLAMAVSWLGPSAGRSRQLTFQALLELRSSQTARAVARALVRQRGEEPIDETGAALLHTLAQPERRRRPMRGVVRELVNALADERDEVGERAEELLLRLAPATTSALITELRTGRAPERAAAVLGRLGDPAALEALVESLDHRRTPVRIQAAAALGAIRDPAAVEPLMYATRDRDPDVRAEAGHALDVMGTAAVIVGMSALIQPMVAEAVAGALDRPAANGHDNGVRQIPAPAQGRHFVDALTAARAAAQPAE